VNDAERLRSHAVTLLDDSSLNPALVDRGSMTFVVVGGGATGVESAGAIAEALRDVVPDRYSALSDAAKVHIVDLGDALLAPFSERAHKYAAKRLAQDGVEIHLGVGVKEVRADRVVLTDGSEIVTRTAVWGGGERRLTSSATRAFRREGADASTWDEI
jgi:NADH dehydrogenase